MHDASVKSAKRVFEIIECFGSKRTPLRLKHVVAELSYPSSSVAALLKCMTQLGYLDFDETTHCYSLTSRLADATQWVVPEGDSGFLEKRLRRLQRDCGELVILAAPAGVYTEYIRTYRALGGGVQFHLPPGTRRLMVQGGAGWLFLADRSDEEIAEILRATVAQNLVSEGDLPLSLLLQTVNRLKRSDVVFGRARRDNIGWFAHWGGALISMRIPVAPDSRHLAICLAGPAERLRTRFDELAETLLSCRKEILAQDGDRPGHGQDIDYGSARLVIEPTAGFSLGT